MLANVFTKAVRDRWAAFVVAALVITVTLLGGMAVYGTIDVSFYFDLPDAVLSLIGLPPEGDAGSLAFGAIYNLIGALTMAGLAISMGSSSVAGEEADGTMGLLMGYPLSRSRVLASKAAAIVTLSATGALILWGAGHAASAILGVDASGIDVEALLFHMFVNAVFYGFLAMAIGGWTGNRSIASGISVAVMLIGYLAAGILPLIESLDWLARLFPWYYFNGSQPMLNGFDWGDVGVLALLSSALVVVALVGVNRRDLRQHNVKRTIGDRLRANPRTARLVEKIAGSARVSRIAVKTASDHQGLLIVVAIVMFYMALIMGPLFSILPEGFIDAVRGFPDALLAMVGTADMSTPEGYLQAEIFSLVGPAAVIAVTATMGARALAGEEERHTMGLLLGNPITRRRLIVEKVMAMIAYAFVIGVTTFIGTWIGSALVGLGVPVANIGAVCLLMTLVGLAMGGVALLLGAAIGRTSVAIYGTVGVAVLAYLSWTFLSISDQLSEWALLSPFHYYLGGEPLTAGLSWGHAGVLASIFAVLVAVSIPAFQRRDLRG